MMKMVGNFSSRKAVEDGPAPKKSITVDKYMTKKLVTFKPDQSIREVMDLLVKHNISGGPVVNEQGDLIGMISEGDCLNQVVKSKYYNLPQDKDSVSLHMRTEVITIHPEADIFEAAQQFLTRKIRRFPVVKDGKLLGQISQKDVMKAAMKLSRTTW
ncbi:MAG: CBS domain-containing protein [Bacteroidetes bacterium]|jgi:CBS domain-containing protein|nr:CBS domain-containing protein [Bacteroidota bacterium]